MHFPKLSPLQSRLAASMTASVLLLFVCCFLLSSHFADASDVDSIHPEDHNHQRLGEGQQGDFEFDSSLESTDTYEPEFLGVNRGIIGRAPDGVVSLVNNVAQNLNINPGWTDNWMFSKDSVNGPKSPQTSGLPSEVQKRQNEKQDLDTPADLESSNAILDDDSPGEKQILKARQGNTTMQRVWITVNTCLQPSSNTSSGTLTGPPQLELYVSVDGTNQKPGPDQDSARQAMSILDGGYGSVVIDANTDIYIGISAPESSSFNGIYNYDVAASIDAPYHSVNETNPFLFLIDSDSSSALLITNNLTQASEDDPVFQEWTKISPPFNLFAQNQNNTAIFGLQNSYCGLKNNAQVTAYLDGQATHNIDVGITTRGLGNKPKQQFYLKGLNDSSSYYGFLSMQGNSTAFGPGVVGGGGKVWKSMNFTTKSDGNCQVIFNLSFCSEVAYAAPSNLKTFPNVTNLTSFYDNTALALYQNFSYSLAQIACETTADSQYSLVRTCDDCNRAYKEWLCAVSIPRCDDFSSDLPFLAPRNIGQPFTNSTSIDPNQVLYPSGGNGPGFAAGQLQQITASNQSRNILIDQLVKPGPYKEILPCKDLCYSLVQSCPAALGFGCPHPGRGLEMSYGDRSSDGDITCSFLGAAFGVNASTRLGLGFWGGLVSILGMIWNLI